MYEKKNSVEIRKVLVQTVELISILKSASSVVKD